MFESMIAPGRLMVSQCDGIAPEIDALAGHNLAGHGFLRRAWYAAGSAHPGRTLVLRRADSADSAVLAAIPTIPFGPAIAGARKVPGSYWPFRAPLIAPDCDAFELAHGLQHRAARRLGPVWRVGPARTDDPVTLLLIEAAQLAGWTILSRSAGTSWVIDLDAARREGWPRASTAKRLAKAERRLANLGPVHWRHVRGAGWDAAVLDELAAVEAASWIATTTDGSGAKFMTAQKRALWRDALTDPVLAANLCATILTVDGRAVAFSFDLDDGPVQYGIAGTYVSDFGKHEVGKLANYRAVTDAIADGQSVMDLGVGDSGYKRDMGAVEGYRMADLLFVRSRAAAALLARMWGEQLAPQGLVELRRRMADGRG